MEMHQRITGIIMLLLLIVGCAAPTQQAPQPAACAAKDCFIAAANACEALDVTLTEEAGVLKYSSSNDCVFTKTLVSANPQETPEMKALVEGKSLTCGYEKDKFDARWATSLIFGMEKCEGPLKDILVDLLAFA